MGSGQHNPLEVGAPVGGLDRLGKRGEGKGEGGTTSLKTSVTPHCWKRKEQLYFDTTYKHK